MSGLDPAQLRSLGMDYVFDEEAHGFPEPARGPDPLPSEGHGTSLPGQLGKALCALGLVLLCVQWATGALANTFATFALAFLMPSAGAALYFVELYRHKPPGIRNDALFFRGLTARGAAGWVAGILLTAFYVLIYFHPQPLGWSPGYSGPEGWVQGHATGGLVAMVAPLADVLGVTTSQWFLYGVVYTLSIAVFGVRAAMRYRHNRYQLVRTGSVVFFQTLFAWYLPQLLVRFQQPYMEFNGVWPLKNNYLWPEKISGAGEFVKGGGFGLVLAVIAVALVVAIPVLTYFFGKRWYCSWVCGCGGLAETVGDPWRQNSDKSRAAWKLERVTIYTVLGLVLLTTGLLWWDYAETGSAYGSWAGKYREWYGFYIGALFAGVAGVGFYPILGTRVWCRFGCPLAAILGILQRVFSRFRITTNGGQCISCGNCSTYCEMGIDVRDYAQRSENIVRASCVGCGVCAAVCPRGVLKLENGASVLDEERFTR